MEEYQLTDSLKLASDIVKLDREREEIWEELLREEGDRALEILRYVQNYR